MIKHIISLMIGVIVGIILMVIYISTCTDINVKTIKHKCGPYDLVAKEKFKYETYLAAVNKNYK